MEFFKILSPSQICDESTYLALWTFWRRNFYFKISYKMFGVIYDHVPGIWYVRLTLLIVSEKKIRAIRRTNQNIWQEKRPKYDFWKI